MTVNTTPRNQSKTAKVAAFFVEDAKKLGFRVRVSDSGTVTIEKAFTPEVTAEYVQAENDAWYLMAQVPLTGSGSTWGTTGDGVGGHSGLKNGYMRLNRSAVSKRFVAAVTKLV